MIQKVVKINYLVRRLGLCSKKYSKIKVREI